LNSDDKQPNSKDKLLSSEDKLSAFVYSDYPKINHLDFAANKKVTRESYETPATFSHL
jgi:hypothetical protein